MADLENTTIINGSFDKLELLAQEQMCLCKETKLVEVSMEFFSGNVYHCAWYDHPLSTTEFQQNFNALPDARKIRNLGMVTLKNTDGLSLNKYS